MGLLSRSSRMSNTNTATTTKNNNKKNEDDDDLFSSRPTSLRVFTACVYLVALVFLILVEIGSINNDAVIRSTYFLKIEMANIIPASVPNAVFINSIAQSIGLHDFYQVGLWDFCEGYNGQGITHCSRPKSLYWFNPVEIILHELLAGASITLPSEIIDVLHLVRLASSWMFSCFLVGTVLTFLCVFLAPIGFSKHPRWEHRRKRVFFRQLPISILAFGALLFTVAAALIATVMFIIFRDKFSGAADLNIRAQLGVPMLAFMWIATGLNFLGFILQIGTCCGVCCCTGRRRALRRRKEKAEPDLQALDHDQEDYNHGPESTEEKTDSSTVPSRLPASVGFRRTHRGG